MLVRRVAALGDHALPALGARALPRPRLVEPRHPVSGGDSGSVLSSARRSSAAARSRRRRRARGRRTRGSRRLRARPTRRVASPSRIASCTGSAAIAATTAGYQALRTSRLRESRRTSRPCLNASRRMPSSLRSKSQSGPVKRSCVSVAAIGSSHVGSAGDTRPAGRRCRRNESIAGNESARRCSNGRTAMPTRRERWRNTSRNTVIGAEVCDLGDGGRSRA